MSENTVKKNLSVEKVLDILEVMAEYGEPVRIQELSDKLNISAPTVYRFLKTLVESGYVMKDDNSSRYYLTLKMCYVADLIRDRLNIREVIYPFLKQLANLTGETASLVIEQDNMAVYIDKVESADKMIKSFQHIGYRAPLYCTGVGKVFLSEMDESTKRSILDKGMERLTLHTITDKGLLEEELSRIRSQGYSIDNEECEIGARCIAVPVRDYTGKIAASISISGPAVRMADSRIKEIKTDLIRMSKEVSRILGYK